MFSRELSFSDQIDAVLNNTFNNRLDLYVMETPEYLINIKFPAGPLLMKNGKISDILEDHKEMEPDIIKKIPELIKDPIMALTSKRHPEESVVLITEYTTPRGEIVIPIWVNQEGNYVDIDLNEFQGNTNFVASAYGRTVKGLIEEAYESNNIVYASENKKRISTFLTRNGLQLPTPLRIADSKIKVPQNYDDIKIKEKKYYDSDGRIISARQYEYFKNSRIRDKNGNLLPVYHGTPYGGFTVFKNDLNYYTPNKEYADRYQNPSASSIRGRYDAATQPMTYEGYINITKPFDVMGNRLHRDIFVKEYVKGGYAAGINPYISEREIINQIKNGIDWTEADNLKEFFDDNEYDFDGLILNEGGDTEYGDRGVSYVTFNSNQFKSIDNVNPTDNPDINFSRELDDARVKSYEELEATIADLKERVIDLRIDNKNLEWERNHYKGETRLTAHTKGSTAYKNQTPLISEGSSAYIARNLIKRFGSTVDYKELVPDIQKWVTYLASHKDENTFAKIPSDYTALSNEVTELKEDLAEVSEHTKNVFSGTIEQGNISKGENTDDAREYFVRSKDYTEVSGEYAVISFYSPMNKGRVYYYKADKSYISYQEFADRNEGGNIRRVATLTLPPETKYMRFKTQGSSAAYTYTPSDIDRIQIENGYVVTDYILPYTAKDDVARYDVNNLSEKFNNYTESVGTTKFNLIEPSDFKVGGYYTDVFNPSTNYVYTELMAVKPNTIYAISSYRGDSKRPASPTVATYDKYGGFLQWFSSGFTPGDGCNKFRTQENCEFIRLSYTVNSYQQLLICEGDNTPSVFVGKKVDLLSTFKEDVPYEYALNNVCCIGDSLTYGLYVDITKGGLIQNYPYYLSRMINTTVDRIAVSGGYPQSIYNGLFKTTDFKQYDAVLMWLGTNGGMENPDTQGTQAWYYEKMITEIKAQNPNCQIFLANVFVTGRINDSVPEVSVKVTNETINTIADKYGLCVVDMTDLTDKLRPDLRNGINNNTHFGKAGMIYIADRWCRGIRKYLASDPTKCEFGLHFDK